MGLEEIDFKKIWTSMFREELCSNKNGEKTEIIGPILLLETAIIAFRRLGSEYYKAQEDLKTLRKELALKISDISSLKEQLDETRAPCPNCVSLNKDILALKKRANNAETRVSQIANILNLRCGESQNTLSLVSQVLCEPPSKTKELSPKIEKTGTAQFAIPETEDEFKADSCSDDITIIPETNVDLCSPNVSKKIRKVTPSNSPARQSKRNKTDSQSPRRNLAQEFRRQSSDDSPAKGLSFNIGGPDSDESGGSHSSKTTLPPLDKTLEEYVQQGRNHLNDIWFGEPQPSTSRSPKKSPRKVWKMKQKLGLGSPHKGKKMKQLTLSVSHTDKFVNVLTSVQSVSDDDDDIILPSPKKKSEKSLSKSFCSTLDDTFAPPSCSTQKPSAINNSFDRIPEKKTDSPQFVYKEAVVRGKEARAQLQGWDCADCRKYYELAGLSPSKIKTKMNTCSKHRSKNPQRRIATPPGFWDVDINDSTICSNSQ